MYEVGNFLHENNTDLDFDSVEIIFELGTTDDTNPLPYAAERAGLLGKKYFKISRVYSTSFIKTWRVTAW